MVAIDVIDTTVRATDRVDNVVEVETVGWDEIDPQHAFPRQVDARIGGRVTELVTTASFAEFSACEGGESDTPRPIEPDHPPIEPTEPSLLTGEGPITVSVRFDPPARIEYDGDSLALSFEQPTPITIGFESRVSYPRHTVTVQRTTAGVATAISHFAAAVRQGAPHRSAEPYRRHPPRLEYGNRTDVPEAISANVPESGLELAVPDTLASLFPAAPLSYYLSARVVPAECETARLRTTDGSVLADLGSLPEYQYAVARLLRRIFLLECLVRYDQTSSADPAEVELCSQLDFDPAAYVDASDVERVRTCLDLEFERVSRSLPEWHAVSFVEPTWEHARGLPYLVRNLSVVMLPDAAPGRDDPDGRHEAVRERRASVPSRAIDGGPHGSALAWLSEADPPADTLYVPTVESYESSTRYLDRWNETDRVAVVCNDDERRPAARQGTDLLGEHGPDDLEIDVRHNLPRAQLRELIEAGVDLLHFVGAVDDGLACPDGTLDPAGLERSNARVVFLDGADGFETGRDFVRNGCVAGIVRDGPIGPLDPEPREQLFGLLARGFTIDEAVRYATEPSASPPFRALGDAFVQFTQSMKLYCTPATIESVGVDRFRVRAHQYIPKAGFIWRAGIEGVPAQLCAQPIEFTATGPQLANVVAGENLVPIVDGEIHWDVDRHPFSPFV